MTSGGATSGGSALFTPTPMILNGLFNSLLFSSSASIASMKGKKKLLIRAVTSGKEWDADLNEEDELGRELDNALEELDVPSSSLANRKQRF
jgi:hypothetical protein